VPEGTQILRDESGRFLPGQSANPGGKKHFKTRMREAFEECATPEDVRAVWQALVKDAKMPGKHYRSKQLVLEYALGKPQVQIEHVTANSKLLEALLADDRPLIPPSESEEIEAEVRVIDTDDK
jgi:hypothetical protein